MLLRREAAHIGNTVSWEYLGQKGLGGQATRRQLLRDAERQQCGRAATGLSRQIAAAPGASGAAVHRYPAVAA